MENTGFNLCPIYNISIIKEGRYDEERPGLQSHYLNPGNIEYVICTHAHPETVGNLSLFPNATHIIGHEIVKRGRYFVHDFKGMIPFEIDNHVQIIATPGFTHSAVSVLVSQSNLGTVAIADSVFHSEKDLEDPDIWMESSLDPNMQEQSRITILKEAQFIIPRYGKCFQVPDCYKTSEMQVVMTP